MARLLPGLGRSLAAGLGLVALAPVLLSDLAAPSRQTGQLGAAAAQVHIGLTTGDEVKGWLSVGKLVLGERGFCTGTLIAPQLVLTAAHCLFDKETSARMPDSQITFQGGWRNGRAEAYRTLRRSVVHPDYIYAGDDDLERVGYDLALLELDRPILLPQMGPFTIGEQPAVGSAVSVVSYALDRSEVPSIERDCAVVAEQAAALVLSCDIDFGSSGAPVFQLSGGEPEVVSVISAKAEMGGRKVALAVPLEAPLAQLIEELGRKPLGARLGKSVPLLRHGDGAAGAKFITP